MRARHPQTCAATPETRARAQAVCQGALARLHVAGTISIEQLGAAMEIADVAEQICAGIGVRTVSWETRVETSRAGDAAFWESLGRVRREMAYSRWRAALPQPAAPVLAMIIEDCGIHEAARRFGMHRRRARRLLLAALDLWQPLIRQACDEVDPASLAAAHAGLL